MTKEELLQIPFYIEDISGSTNTVIIKKSVSSAPTLNLEYSTDGITWTTQTMNEDTTANTFTVPANGKLYLRGVNNGWCSSSSNIFNSYYNSITATGSHNVGGNIMSLLYGSEFEGKTTFPTSNSFVLSVLFKENKTLVNAKDLILPATTLANYCYYWMFLGCSSLTTAPELPATTLVEGCYYAMFEYCSSLTTAPALPATTLAVSCYYYMFSGTNVLPDCSNIDFTSEIVVQSGGLQGLFGGTKVTDEDLFNILPINEKTGKYWLPVMNLTKDYCYSAMFQGCSKLTTAPELPATTLVEGCYYDMFFGCSKLNYIKADFIKYSNDNYEFMGWVSGVSSTGTFVMNPNATYNPDEIRGNSGIPTGWTVEKTELPNYFFIEDISGSENTVSITKNNASAPTLNLEYSTDGTTWYTKSMNSSTTANTFTLPANGKLYLRGVNDGWGNFSYYNTITCNGNHNVGGNIMSLLYGTEFINKTSFPTTNGYVLKGLFHFNNKLVNAQDLQLPATTLAYGCYSEMFYSCYSLTTAPELPATTLTGDCYYWMFMGCSSLTTAPELPATTLATSCYQNMFNGCSKLNYIKADFVDYDSNNTYNWVKNVSSTGTFVMNPNATYNPENIRGVDGIPTNWNVHTNNYFYIEDISNTENIVSITKNNASAPTLNLEYSYNKSEWFSVTMNSDTTANTFTIPTNGKIYFRGVNNGWCDSSSSSYYNKITCSGNHNVGGNIMCLLYGSNFGGKTSFPTSSNYVFNSLFYYNTTLVNTKELQLPATTLAGYCYREMFRDCTSLTTAPALQATTLAYQCYSAMFYGCSKITTAPQLPATTLTGNCYSNMFNNCRSLTTAPELPATTLAQGCYYYMFSGCTSLTTTPELPVTTLANYCYSNMFAGCSSLTEAPELPATTLAKDCYNNMFGGCNKLTTAPELPATTLAQGCYSSMFYNCKSLITAPELPATTLAIYCYQNMFNGCTKLNYIKADFINYSNNNNEFTNWVKGVAKEGTFKLPLEATYNPEDIRGVNGIPTGWNIEKIYSHTHIYNDSQDINTLIIKNNNSDLECLVDMGTEWVSLPHNETSNIEFENVIIIKGNNTTLDGVNIKTSNPSTLNGNIMSLLYGNDYKNKIVFPENSKNTFKYLFLGYDKLVDISKLELPATELASNCYHHMFTGCKSLKSIPELPANDLTNKCYHGMFMNCDGIDKATLSAQYLAPYAYSNMFLGSDNLSDVTVTYKDDVNETNYKGWLNGVSVNGEFKYNHTEEVEEKLIRSNYYVPITWGVTKTE